MFIWRWENAKTNLRQKSINLHLENMSLRPRLIITYLASILIPLLIFGGILYIASMIEFETEMRKVSLQSVNR